MICIVELTVCQPAPRFFTVSGWVGWGMLIVLSLTHMVDATQCTRPSQPAHMVDATQCTRPSQPAHMVDATRCTQCNRNARVLLSPRHTVDATQCARLAEPAHMVDATQCTCLSTRSCPTQGIFERCPSCTNLLQRVLSKSRSVPFIQMATRLGKMNVADWV